MLTLRPGLGLALGLGLGLGLGFGLGFGFGLGLVQYRHWPYDRQLGRLSPEVSTPAK